MAGTSLTHYAEQILINDMLRGVATTFPPTWYLGLYTSDPTDTGAAGTEVSGGSYARQTISFIAPSASGTGSQTSNTANVTFPQATVAWGTVSFFGIMDDPVAGNMWLHGAVASPGAVNTSQVFQVGTSQLVVSFD